ncbi:MAG: hypothetical protein AB7F75_11135 [Planctomycetota bacterium]
MTIWVGIDEAGYGPTLGPLCVGLWCLQSDLKPDDLWKALPSITQDVAQWRKQLAVVDSKELYKGPLALERLECSALALAGAVSDLESWLSLMGDWVPGELLQYPWHRKAQSMPLTGSSLHADHRASLVHDLNRRGIDIKASWVRPVMVRRFNAMLKEGNKSTLEFGVIMDMVDRLLTESRGEEVNLTCDKLGGRDRYAPMLAARFPMEEVRILAESRRESRYEIPGRKLSLTFKMGADGEHPLVSGASILAKYTREVMMHSFNEFWCEKLPGLEPTAGYPEDARRFIHAVTPIMDAMGYSASWLVREK